MNLERWFMWGRKVSLTCGAFTVSAPSKQMILGFYHRTLQWVVNKGQVRIIFCNLKSGWWCFEKDVGYDKNYGHRDGHLPELVIRPFSGFGLWPMMEDQPMKQFGLRMSWENGKWRVSYWWWDREKATSSQHNCGWMMAELRNDNIAGWERRMLGLKPLWRDGLICRR